MDQQGVVKNFVTRPPRGWLHSDQLLTVHGVNYTVRYIGCLQVNTPMKSLDFDTRSQVAKECISRVCEAAGIVGNGLHSRHTTTDRRVLRAIASQQPRLHHAGANVTLTVSAASLTLTAMDTGQLLARHDMPHVSFACGGDTDTLDFVAYVAKDARDGVRACYVLECGGGGHAADVITTIGQAFELRYQQLLLPGSSAAATTTAAVAKCCAQPVADVREYYNDLPGKVPPDVPLPLPLQPQISSTFINNAAAAAATDHNVSSNPNSPMAANAETASEPNLIELHSEHEYVNQHLVDTAREQLENEVWFHGRVTRQQAEALLTQDGEFLVRESVGAAGQLVLTGLQSGHKKHLLLVDPEGVVRTKDRIFHSVSHLVSYHMQHQIPIISEESALLLRHPVPRARSTQNCHIICLP